MAYHWAALLARHWTSPGYIDALASRRYVELGDAGEVFEERSTTKTYEVVDLRTIEVPVRCGIGHSRKH